MSEPFIAEIRIFAGSFAPRGWAFCNGQLMPIAQNSALFSLVGTTYGGDGRNTFGLPDLRGRTPLHPGQGPGLTRRRLGEKGGAGTVTLTQAEMAAHNHGVRASAGAPDATSPEGAAWAGDRRSRARLYSDGAADVRMSPQALQAAGGFQPHNNRQPGLGINFIIALVGIFPPRS
ncbi:phage tail protein [Alloalcanivorax gelatiniphagus]|uniref:Phage tail protein n=3 Tax=Alloalcanivorax gelatiniphagus TaxID=1194167 RepID=A0ABY2XMH1_9GAMM|nr:tail fiber protein [Alloalcanivorax gelatiniphagus]TMW13034.1 phage tail protein [Alloalcanivorax gelatiniphagus]